MGYWREPVSDRQAWIQWLCSRYTLREVGQRVGVTGARIRQIRVQAERREDWRLNLNLRILARSNTCSCGKAIQWCHFILFQ